MGTAPAPALTAEQRRLAETDLDKLRADLMRKSKKANLSPLKAWQNLEKEIEIDRSLSEFQAAGVQVTYHSCDVANRSQLGMVLNNIRKQSGPLLGVIHGAGIGKDAGFSRKEPAMVERCLSAKLDGALNLMALTRDDQLQAFIAFGSISGRFGANGHTDYSLANDMLAKIVGWHRQLRPSVASTVFHWHAWDDIGMATKPETRLALEMIGMTLMPAREGAEHFMGEIEAGLPDSEVIITDTRYYRIFYPADRMLESPGDEDGRTNSEVRSPLIHNSKSLDSGIISCEAELNPLSDPFLTEHRLRDRPLLPMVIMTELLAEGASSSRGGKRPTGLRDLEIHSSVKFPTDAPCQVEINSTTKDPTASVTELRADFRSRSGKLVTASRLCAKAIVEFSSGGDEQVAAEKLDRAELRQLKWEKVEYPAAGSDFYVGGPLRCLRKYALDRDRKCIWGRISAPSLGELAGVHRDVSNWLTPSAILDATLFASGILSWNCIRPGVALPQGVQHISFRRLARPAELCYVRSQFMGADEQCAWYDITVWGSDALPILIVKKYVAGWLPS